MKFCFLLGKTAGETVVMLETAYKEAALGKHKFTSGFPVSGMVNCHLQTNLAQGDPRPPERMKTSREFVNWSWKKSQNNWRSCWFVWCVLQFLSTDFERGIANEKRCSKIRASRAHSWSIFNQKPHDPASPPAIFTRSRSVQLLFIPLNEKSP